MVLYDEPKYPVIDSDPGLWKGLKFFRSSDWQMVAGATAGSTVLGYFMGRRTFLHRPTAAVAGFMGALFGVAYGEQNSMGRLMGLVENSLELEASKKEQS